MDGRKTVCVETLRLDSRALVQGLLGKEGRKEKKEKKKEEAEQKVWVDVWRRYLTFKEGVTEGEMGRVVEGVVREWEDGEAGEAGRDGEAAVAGGGGEGGGAGVGVGAGAGAGAPEPESTTRKSSGGITELRRLVFLREREPGSKLEPARAIRVPYKPDFSFTMTPDATLLFQFSALTFNAHAIHLDPLYAREVEGYKERLVHGPLTLVIMLRAVEGFVRGATSYGSADTGAGDAAHPGIQITEAVRERLSVPERDGGESKKQWEIASIEYKNLRPLFVGEEMKVCVRLLPNKEVKRDGSDTGLGTGERRERVDVWIEAPDGGLAVKGTVIVEWR